MSFVTRCLGDISDEVDGTIRTGPFGSQLHESDYVDEGIPVVMPKNIVEGKVAITDIARIREKDADRLSQHRLQPGDIVYGRRGDIGRRALVTKREDGWLCGTGCLRVSLRDSVLDPTFLYYYLGQPNVVAWIYNQAVGATMPNLNTTILRSVPISYPPLPTQRKIASVLSAYDDLIENNTRRIEILEEMAQAIYQEWFVNFRFPGHEKVRMVDSALGPIPDGWAARRVKSLLKRLKAGNTYKEADVAVEGKVPVIDQSRNDFLGFHNNAPDHVASPQEPIVIFGDHTCKMQLIVEPFSVGPNVVPFISPDETPILFLYFLVGNLVETREYKRHWTELTNKKVVLPPMKLARRFCSIIAPMFEYIHLLTKKNLNLRHTRDLLLPKLVSGTVDLVGVDVGESNDDVVGGKA